MNEDIANSRSVTTDSCISRMRKKIAVELLQENLRMERVPGARKRAIPCDFGCRFVIWVFPTKYLYLIMTNKILEYNCKNKVRHFAGTQNR